MILTVGDSFTYGAELEDQTSAWPYLIGRTVKNQGKGGSSNDRIFRVTVEETATTKFDFVIVEWSFPNRKEVFQIDDRQPGPICINHSFSSMPWVGDYFKYSYDRDFAFRQWFTQMIALQGYLKSIDQKYLFCNVAGLQGDFGKYYEQFGYLFDRIDKKFYVGWPLEGMLEWAKGTPCGQGGHFLEQGHQRVAEKINEHIRNLSWLS